MNPEYDRLKTENLSIAIRSIVGKSVDPSELYKVSGLAEELIERRDEYRDIITQAHREHIFNIGKSAMLSGKYIIKRLKGQL